MLKNKTFASYTFGCKLNFSETSTIDRQLLKAGYRKINFDQSANMYLINTCSVTENANKKCLQLIRKVKKYAPNSFIIVTGCFAQLKPKVISENKDVDIVLGAKEKFNLPKILEEFQNNYSKIYGCDISNLDFRASFSVNDRTRSFLKIQDGCDYPCSYCTIPFARGKSRSDNFENIIKNINEISKNGVKEIVLTGVNIGDFKNKQYNFSDLVKLLDSENKIDRYRISSIEPNLITNRIIDTVKNSKRFMPHFHIPLQSGSDIILGKMKRRYQTKLYKQKIVQIKKSIPNVCIGADVIVGFPGETEEEFRKSYEFIKSLELSYLHVFTYSERENTEAERMPNKIELNIRAERSKKMRILSEKLRRSFNQKNLNSVRSVLFEDENKNGFLHGFTDNYIKVKIPFQEVLRKRKQNVKLLAFDEDGLINVK